MTPPLFMWKDIDGRIAMTDHLITNSELVGLDWAMGIFVFILWGTLILQAMGIIKPSESGDVGP
jgi:hypothetical protein